ncbi:MAG TPA: KUP/HAK/KT family potassium transporter, partial [Thermoanaerobaculia bacterium]|nr:KUP/HAK/KT family potassium transporter [Thermoanaerobaculia bacterium]
RQSGNLAAAYGVAVTATMAITTTLFSVQARERWRWPLLGVVAFAIFFLCIDLSFFSANIVKIAQGGWFPLAVGLVIYTLMSTWRLGRQILNQRLASQMMSFDDFLRDLPHIPRVAGTAIFMTRSTEGIPTTLLHNLKHNKVVHQKVVILTVETEETSHLSPEERYEWADLGNGVYRLVLRFGFMEDVALPEMLTSLKDSPVTFSPMTTSYFLGRETLIPTRHPGMAIWREHLFAWMVRNATSASHFFGLPPNQVIELGAQVEI